MTATQNKINFGLKNVHYAAITDNGSTITYGIPVAMKGGVSISISPNGELTEVHADDIVYWTAEVNNGYDGEIQILDLPESFATDILGDEVVEGVQYESAEQKGKRFALLFEIDGDQHKKRYVLYNCTATRPTIASNTKGTTVEPQNSSLTFNARPHNYNYLIKANTTASVLDATFKSWFTTVHEKSVVPGA